MLREAEESAGVDIAGLVTFHDGFRYFAAAFDLPLLASIEEEEGSEASAKEINEITGLVKEYSLPVIFTEVNGSDAHRPGHRSGDGVRRGPAVHVHGRPGGRGLCPTTTLCWRTMWPPW